MAPGQIDQRPREAERQERVDEVLPAERIGERGEIGAPVVVAPHHEGEDEAFERRDHDHGRKGELQHLDQLRHGESSAQAPARESKGCTCETPPLADFRARAGRILETASRFRNWRWLGAFRAIETGAPILRRRQPGMRLEGPIERPDRAEAGVERDRQDRHLGLGGIAQRGLGLGQPIAVDEGAEIAMAELLVDQTAQPIFGNVELLRQRRDAQVRLAIDLVVVDQLAQRGEQRRVGPGWRRRCPRVVGEGLRRPGSGGAGVNGCPIDGSESNTANRKINAHQTDRIGETERRSRQAAGPEPVGGDDQHRVERDRNRKHDAKPAPPFHQVGRPAGQRMPDGEQDTRQ